MQTALYEKNRFHLSALFSLEYLDNGCKHESNIKYVHPFCEWVGHWQKRPSPDFFRGSITICSRKICQTFARTLFKMTLSLYQDESHSAFVEHDSHECVWFFSFLFCICVAQGAVGCSKQAELSMNHGSKALVQEEMTQFFWLKDGRRHFLPLLLLVCSCTVASLTYACSLLAHKLDRGQVSVSWIGPRHFFFSCQYPFWPVWVKLEAAAWYLHAVSLALGSDWVCYEEVVIITDAVLV